MVSKVSSSDIRRLLIEARPQTPCLRECAEALASEGLREVGAGSDGKAGDALSLYEIRAWSTERAGIDTCGFPETLDALRRLAPDEKISLFHFAGAARAFSIVFSHANASIIGCIRVRTPDARPV